MKPHERDLHCRELLMQILMQKGKIYTLGLLMGIIVRLCRSDYALVRELENRVKDLKD
jgi:hypothetical protein